MKGLSIFEKRMLDKIHIVFDDLLSTHDKDVEKLFIESFKKGHSPELMGEFFERSLAQIERKDKGQYYTPKAIVEYMLSQLNITKDSKILDPACGCGSFLLTVFDVFKEKFGLRFLNNIFGVDINSNAAKMTRACLYMKSGFNDDYISVIKKNIKAGNSLVSKNEIDRRGFDWYSEFHNVMKESGFDFIVGNPPYVTLRRHKDFDPLESIYSKVIHGPVNAATLMIARSLELLKKEGVLAFLLPKSILYVDSYINLRRYLIQNTELLQIFDLGSKFKNVRGEQIILIIKKKTPAFKNRVKISVFDYKDKGLSKQPYVMIEQSKFSCLNRFLTFGDREYYKLVDKISKIGTKLDRFVDGRIFRGLPIGGNQIKVKNADNKDIEVIRGKNITKFAIKNPYALDRKLLEKQGKSKVNSLKNKKVVLQNIFSSESGVIAAYDDRKLLTLDTVTNILVSDNEKGKYILALLNSKLINFHLMYGVFDKSRLTMHLDKSYIGLVPIVDNPDRTRFRQLIKIADSIIVDDKVELKKEKNRDIDVLVYDIYSLNKKEIKLVEKAVSKMLSKRSVW